VCVSRPYIADVLIEVQGGVSPGVRYEQDVPVLLDALEDRFAGIA